MPSNVIDFDQAKKKILNTMRENCFDNLSQMDVDQLSHLLSVVVQDATLPPDTKAGIERIISAAIAEKQLSE